MKILKTVLVILLFFVGFIKRVEHINQVGKDINTYKDAVITLLDGGNPYVKTVRTYSEDDGDPWDHGFAYLPGLLFVNAPLYLINQTTNIPLEILWKIPIIIADGAIAALLFRLISKRNYLLGVFSTGMWLLNPYLMVTGNYTYFDPLAILFMFLALHFLENDDVLSGSFFALSVAFKTFPILLLPLFLIKSKQKWLFIFSTAIIGVVLSIPFMTSFNNFTTYLNGSLLVHGARHMQGRPFLFYISYLFSIEFFQIVPIKIYTYLATFSGWLVIILISIKNKFINKYILATIPFILFYIFTPVFNRTYLLWIIPIFFVALTKLFKKNYYVYLFNLIFYGFYFWYLSIWKDGFHIKPPKNLL